MKPIDEDDELCLVNILNRVVYSQATRSLIYV